VKICTYSHAAPGESPEARQVRHLENFHFDGLDCGTLRSNYSGCTYDISNKHRLGYSEVELVQKMIDGVNSLVVEDRELQKKHAM